MARSQRARARARFQARARSSLRVERPFVELTSPDKGLPPSVAKTAAWTRKEGKNPAGGLNAKGRASYKGGTLKAPVKSGDNPRRASFLARMGNMPGPERDSKGRPTRLLLSLQAWGASSKADAKAKAKAISARNK